jgi:uncharacterized protein involved in type VI secretion and phage assembly
MRDPTPGVVIGKVTNVHDPEGLGRIQVCFPWLGDAHTEWVAVASIMAGKDRGAFFMPEVEDEVLLAFQQGDWDHPFVIGFLWNAVQTPPSRDERQRMIRSVNGHTIRFVDSEPSSGNRGALIIEDAHGNVITLTNGVVTIHSKGHLALTASTMTIMNRPVRPVGGPI